MSKKHQHEVKPLHDKDVEDRAEKANHGEDPSQPLERIDPEVPADEQPEETEKKAPKKASKKADVQEEKEDRSAFNCPDCKGLGLQDSFHVCSHCMGTGKV